MIKRSYLLTKVMGIPVRVHITLIILLIIAAFHFRYWGVLFMTGLFASVALHELGHSWVAIRKGCRVREIMLLPIGGVAKIERLPDRPMDEFLIAVAGPLTSLTLAGIFLLLAGTGFLPVLFEGLAGINLSLGLFNLLPSFPMDGGRIFRAFMTPRIGRLQATALAARIGRIMAVAGAIFGLLNHSFILVLIAIFIYNAAGAEYRAMYMQQMSQEWFTVGQQPADIDVSPPPYARRASPVWKKWSRKVNSFFNDLFKNWQ
jgi:stage IV sporulation protein FB